MSNNTKWTDRELKDHLSGKDGKSKTILTNPITQKSNTILIGIDPGTNTGFAVNEFGKLIQVETLTIIEAILRVHAFEAIALQLSCSLVVRIEDARLRTYFGKTGPEKWKGAGSIMRDCKIWEDEMQRRAIQYQMVHPKNVKETTAKQFEQLCGWTKKTSIHAREAAWMII